MGRLDESGAPPLGRACAGHIYAGVTGACCRLKRSKYRRV